MTHAHVPAPAEMMRDWLRHSAQQVAEAVSAAGTWVQGRTHWPQHRADYYPPRREASFEEAAMAREMYRL
ncbi:hypothetical protein ACJH6J_01730 [Mycobacterium sp. SMC-18]|uniref:hypothetical protein n=1 Tax=unclassified Mycobacterium TaxID=2642494 RepID=UPI0011535AC5|nr:hypothetical protein [Mycobacterium sp. ST-F2]